MALRTDFGLTSSFAQMTIEACIHDTCICNACMHVSTMGTFGDTVGAGAGQACSGSFRDFDFPHK